MENLISLKVNIMSIESTTINLNSRYTFINYNIDLCIYIGPASMIILV